jgi:hypothetical protein
MRRKPGQIKDVAHQESRAPAGSKLSTQGLDRMKRDISRRDEYKKLETICEWQVCKTTPPDILVAVLDQSQYYCD